MSSASAAPADVVVDRDLAVAYLVAGGPSVRRAAETALLGSDADLRAFFESGRVAADDADARAAAQVAVEALGKSPADVQAFVSGGWETSWDADKRVRGYRVLEAASGPTVKAAAQKALDGSPEDLKQVLSSGREAATYADDRLAATRMLTGGVNNSGPVLDGAAQQALRGSADELREFLETGQFVARARDAELASIAFDHRMANKVHPGQNVSVFELDSGEVISASNIPRGDHAEEVIDTYLRDRGIDPDKVTRVYSERSPCSTLKHACAGKVGRYRNAKVTWSFTDGVYDSDATKVALSTAMGNGKP
ncbi:MAG: hypothetical protein QOC80_576 [Frankiaceae bacterium]|nr:hypothetical protein [Frankiaceae bacterium]